MAERQPEPLSEILSRLFTARGWGRTQESLRLERAWNEAAGEMAARCKVLSLKRGILEVEAADSVTLQELVQFHRRRLLEAMKRSLPESRIKDLKVRAGVPNKN